RHLADDAERAETDDGAVEIGIASAQRHGVTGGGDYFEGGDGRREVLVGVARAVRCGAHRTDHRDVRQRGEVVEGKAGLVERGAKLAVGDAALNGHGAFGGVDVEYAGKTACRDQVAVGVGDTVERVA